MTALVTAAEYKTITRDTATDDATIDASLDAAVLMLNDLLDRVLESGEQTEDVDIEGWDTGNPRIYPQAVPVTVAPAGMAIDGGGFAIIGGSPDFGPFWFGAELTPGVRTRATIVYTGGYTHADLPYGLRRAICRVAHAINVPNGEGGGWPVSMTQAINGDVRVMVDGKMQLTGQIAELVPGLPEQLIADGWVRSL